MSGGGSGHEPLHVGYVGTVMLDVAVPGLAFASQTPYRIAAELLAADTTGVVEAGAPGRRGMAPRPW